MPSMAFIPLIIIAPSLLSTSSALAPTPPKAAPPAPPAAAAARDDMFGVAAEDAMLTATRPGQDSFAGALDVRESDPFGYVDEEKTRLLQAAKAQSSFGEPIADALGLRPAAAAAGGAGAASVALPFAERPSGLDAANLAGDFGFDPFGIADSEERLLFMRAAEIRHARLAMLAAVGWPISELAQPGLARAWDAPSLVGKLGGEAPSVLNGGLDAVPPLFWVAALGAAAVVELAGLQAAAAGAAPGDLGWRAGKGAVAALLGAPVATGAAVAERDAVADAELQNGRVAMLAVTAFVAMEFAAKLDGLPIPVVAQSYALFHPLF